jgi:glycosyltransferase involved in cell wall biosynthesis
MPKYSIIIPTYNRADFLSEALTSVWAQTYQDFEVIVCDDGSTDHTPHVLAHFGDRITVVHTQRRGPGAARNAAVAVAKGTYLTCLDSDDTWLPWTLASIDQVVQQHGPDCLVYMIRTPMEFGLRGAWLPTELKTECYPDFIASPPDASHSGSLVGAIPRALFVATGGFQEDMITDEDLDLLFRLGVGHPYIMITKPVTMLHRTHEGNTARDMHHLCNGGLFLLKREFREQAYAGGAARAHARRSRLGTILARRCVKLAYASQFRLAFRLYWAALRTFVAAERIGFILAFPPYVAARMMMARWGGGSLPPT